MPANIITINNWAEFYIGDSQMNELARWLGEHGFPENKEARQLLKSEGISENQIQRSR